MLIEQCHGFKLIDDQTATDCNRFITSEKVHVEIRNLTMMILLPRKLHMDDETQAAFVRAAVSRVSSERKMSFTNFDQIANPTVLEPRGVSFLRPIWYLIERHRDELIGLNKTEVNVYYKKFINNFKRTLQANEESIEQAVDNRITPGMSLADI